MSTLFQRVRSLERRSCELEDEIANRVITKIGYICESLEKNPGSCFPNCVKVLVESSEPDTLLLEAVIKNKLVENGWPLTTNVGLWHDKMVLSVMIDPYPKRLTDH